MTFDRLGVGWRCGAGRWEGEGGCNDFPANGMGGKGERTVGWYIEESESNLTGFFFILMSLLVGVQCMFVTDDRFDQICSLDVHQTWLNRPGLPHDLKPMSILQRHTSRGHCP